jgi:hypothetical protein
MNPPESREAMIAVLGGGWLLAGSGPVGFAHSVVAIMAARAQRESRKLHWDRETEQILHQPPT